MPARVVWEVWEVNDNRRGRKGARQVRMRRELPHGVRRMAVPVAWNATGASTQTEFLS